MSNVDACERTLAALGDRVRPVDDGLVEAVRSMAAALDENPHNAPLWKQYREALVELMGADDDIDRTLAEALEEIGRAAEVGNSKAAGS